MLFESLRETEKWIFSTMSKLLLFCTMIVNGDQGNYAKNINFSSSSRKGVMQAYKMRVNE